MCWGQGTVGLEHRWRGWWWYKCDLCVQRCHCASKLHQHHSNWRSHLPAALLIPHLPFTLFLMIQSPEGEKRSSTLQYAFETNKNYKSPIPRKVGGGEVEGAFSHHVLTWMNQSDQPLSTWKGADRCEAGCPEVQGIWNTSAAGKMHGMPAAG